MYGIRNYFSMKLDPDADPNQFADDKPKCMEYETILALFRIRITVMRIHNTGPEARVHRKHEVDWSCLTWSYLGYLAQIGHVKGVTKRYCLPWLTNSALVYEPKCGGRGGLRSRIHERTILLRFLGIILRVLILEVSAYNAYITSPFQTTFAQGGGGG